MKAKFKNCVKCLCGKNDEQVFYSYPGREEVYVRKYAKAEHNPSAERFKAIMANLKLLQPSTGYIRDFKNYLLQYNKLRENSDHRLSAWSNLYQKVLFGMVKVIPGLDLATLTKAQILEQNLPCRSVKAAIDWELLPTVRDYERYNALI